MLRHIPNTLTLLNALSGAFATAFAMQNHLEWAAYMILLGALFDFFDGFFARLLNAQSPIGGDLDSLSDIVTFGVAPAAIAYKILQAILPDAYLTIAYVAFLIVPFSALRLAIFNNATNQKSSFIGLPTPAFALLWVGLIFLKDHPWGTFFFHPIALIAYVILGSLLLVSQLPLFALKFSKEKSFTTNKLFFLFLIGAIISLFIFGIGGLFFSILIYIFTGVISLIKK